MSTQRANNDNALLALHQSLNAAHRIADQSSAALRSYAMALDVACRAMDNMYEHRTAAGMYYRQAKEEIAKLIAQA